MANLPYSRTGFVLGLAAALFANSQQTSFGAGAAAKKSPVDDLSYLNEVMTKKQIDAIRSYEAGKLTLENMGNPHAYGTVVKGNGRSHISISKCIVDDEFCAQAESIETEKGETTFYAPLGSELERFIVYTSRDLDCNRLARIAKKLNTRLGGSAYSISRVTNETPTGQYQPSQDCHGFEVLRTKKPNSV